MHIFVFLLFDQKSPVWWLFPIVKKYPICSMTNLCQHFSLVWFTGTESDTHEKLICWQILNSCYYDTGTLSHNRVSIKVRAMCTNEHAGNFNEWRLSFRSVWNSVSVKATSFFLVTAEKKSLIFPLSDTWINDLSAALKEIKSFPLTQHTSYM